MKLSMLSPFRDMEDIFNNFNRQLSTNAHRDISQDTHHVANWSPRADIVESEKEFLIKVELPEVEKEDVKVTINDGVLNISGERKVEKEEKDKIFHRIERFYGRFDRSFTLPENVKQDDIDADFKGGILSLHLEKTEKSKPKSIEVKSAD